MKDVLRSAAMTFTMFSALPMVRVEWKKENMRYMLACLPLVGLVIALALWAWQALCAALSFSTLFYAAGLTLLPVLLSGGIHMDGFCDTVDALSSHAEPARKREILKDSHAGAFAIIFTVVYFVALVALCAETNCTRSAVWMLGLHQMMARAVGAAASVCFPGSTQTGLLASFRDAAARRSAIVLFVWMAACAAAMIALSPVGGCAATAAAGLGMWYVYRMSRREFGGMSGDLAGFLITSAGAAMLLAQVAAERMAAVWF